MNKRSLILFFVLFCSLRLQAQQPPGTADIDSVYEEVLQDEPATEVSTAGILPGDTILSTNPVYIEPDSIRQWKSKKEFAYMKNLDSLLKAAQEQVNAEENKKQPQRRSFADNILSTSFVSTLLIILALFFVAVSLYHLMKSQAVFKRANVTMPAKELEQEEDELLENDYEKLVNQAYKLADFRMGVRYLFLHTLQQLRDKNLIDYAIDKTNTRYAREIPVHLRNDFSKLVLAYEYVWYGNFTVSREQFDVIRKQYSAFSHKI